MHKHQILIAGCGDVGIALGIQLASQGHQVYGLRRNINQLPQSIQGIAADLTDSASLQQLPAHIDIVIYCVAAGKRDEQHYRDAYINGLTNLQAALNRSTGKPKQLFFVSSTAVYNQCQHEWIDETSATEPATFSGQIMLEAEHCALNNEIPGCVVRFSGIYGPGRNYMLRQVKDGTGYAETPLQYSNRIHRDDCVGVLAHLIDRVENQALEQVYLASDSAPAPLYDVTHWLAEQLGTTIQHHSAIRQISSKRCRNQRILDSGYRFKYPDFKAGYASLLEDFKAN
ncbi:MAG: SDR family oxidoreductase [Amphritea sp.]